MSNVRVLVCMCVRNYMALALFVLATLCNQLSVSSYLFLHSIVELYFSNGRGALKGYELCSLSAG